MRNNMKSKKGVGPVIAMAFFIVIAVVAVSSLQLWFKQYSSGLYSDTEQRGINLVFESMSLTELYIKSEKNEDIQVLRITDSQGNLMCDNLDLGLSKLNKGRNIIDLTAGAGCNLEEKNGYSLVIFTELSSLATDRYLG